jgi:hypothetical protein
VFRHSVAVQRSGENNAFEDEDEDENDYDRAATDYS